MTWEIFKVVNNFCRILKCIYMKLPVNWSKIVDMYKKTHTHDLTIIYTYRRAKLHIYNSNYLDNIDMQII